MKPRSNETRDLGVALLTAAMLLFTVGYLTQCRPATPPISPVAESSSPQATPSHGAVHARTESNRKESETGDEQEDEERAKIRNVAHALQTIAESPELRATLGLPK